MNVIIGIISYLPDNEEIRKVRFEKFKTLLFKCEELFDLPIFVVIQNYTDEEIQFLRTTFKHIILSENNPPLGIVGARRYLRTYFLKSSYDYLIMLDDDCVIYGDKTSADNYLTQIYNHPDSFGEFKCTLLKLFAISKHIFSQQDYLDIYPEQSDGFEDTVFVKTLRAKFPDKRFVFNIGNLLEKSLGAKDKFSTWYSNQDLQSMLNKTKEYTNKL